MHKLMDAAQIRQTVGKLAQQLLDDPTLHGLTQTVLVGIRSRGELVAERIAAEIQTRRNLTVPVGALDITLYRDDLAQRRAITVPQGTDMNFRLDDKVVILIDDVLETGRSVRAALDAITDFGRPRLIRLLTLVDKGGREYPIAADYVGTQANAGPQQRILVRLTPTDAEDAVFLAEKT